MLVLAAPGELLGDLDRERSVGRDLLSDLHSRRHQPIGLHYSADEANLVGPPCMDALARQEHFHRDCERNRAYEPHGAIAVDDRPAYLRAAERSGGGRDPEVAALRKLQPTGEAVAVDGCDHRLLRLNALAETCRAILIPQLVRAAMKLAAVKLLEIGTGTEGLGSGASKDCDTQVPILVELAKAARHACNSVGVVSIHRFRAVERDDRNGTTLLIQDGTHEIPRTHFAEGQLTSTGRRHCPPPGHSAHSPLVEALSHFGEVIAPVRATEQEALLVVLRIGW